MFTTVKIKFKIDLSSANKEELKELENKLKEMEKEPFNESYSLFNMEHIMSKCPEVGSLYDVEVKGGRCF